MKPLLLTLTILISLIAAYGQTTFSKIYGTINDDYGYTVKETFDGGYIIGTPYDNGLWAIIKTDAQGDTTWVKKYPFLSSSLNYQFTNSIIQTSDSNYIIVGALPDSNSFVMKVNTIGDTLWLKKSGYGFYPVVYRKIVEDNLGNLIVIGSVEITQMNSCCAPLMSKMDNTGNIVSTWSSYIPCPYSTGCRLQEIFVDIEGNYLVSGDAPSPNVPKPRLTKVDTAGNVLWNKYYSIINGTFISITQEQDSSYLLVGPNWSAIDSTVLFKTDKEGNLQWLKKYKGNAIGWQGVSIDTTNGGYLLSGTNGNITLMKIDLNYNFLWSNEYGGSLDEKCGQMKSTNDGGSIIVGSTKSYGAGGYDVYLIKTNQNGQIVGQFEIESKEHLLIYPNPFSIQTTLQTDNIFKNATLMMYNIQGQRVKQIKNIFGKTITLSRDNLPNGLYFLHITEDNKTFSIDKLLITD